MPWAGFVKPIYIVTVNDINAENLEADHYIEYAYAKP